MMQQTKGDNVHKSKVASYWNSGTLLTFDNGYTVSIQWGPGSYSNNHDVPNYNGNNPDQFINWFHSPWQANNKEFNDHVKECLMVNRNVDKRHTLCFTPEPIAKGWHSTTAEVAVWTESNGERNWKDVNTLLDATYDNKPTTDVQGWLSTTEVAALLYKVSTIKVKGNRIWDRIKMW